MSSGKIWTCAGMVCLAGALLIGRLHAEDKAAPATQPDAAAMMGEMAKLAMPGPQHEMLKKYAGDFKADVEMWMDPSQPSMKSTGKMHNEMVMGGRFLMGTYEGSMMNMPFHGMSCTGYDNGKKKYVGGWIDDMSTGMMMAEGDVDDSGKIVTMSCDMYCPQTKGMIKVREVTKFVDDDTMQFEMYAPGPDGKEMKTMAITYTRIK